MAGREASLLMRIPNGGSANASSSSCWSSITSSFFASTSAPVSMRPSGVLRLSCEEALVRNCADNVLSRPGAAALGLASTVVRLAVDSVSLPCGRYLAYFWLSVARYSDMSPFPSFFFSP